jgi:hypothetical protein
MQTKNKIFYAMDTLVGSCRTVEGAMDLAKFLESKFPLEPRIMGAQLHKFVVVVNIAGKIQVHSAVEVNDIGREDFKKFVAETLIQNIAKRELRSDLGSRDYQFFPTTTRQPASQQKTSCNPARR